ncbi:MAG: hypothetical protein IKR76_00545 [Ruminococcus sp.]|nr:hypothetical protein [Ruminococcus sp.]
MRLFVNELVKAFCRRSVIGVLLGLAVLNGVLLYVSESSNDALYTPAQYRQMYDEISGKPADEVYKNLLERKKELQETESDITQLELTDTVLEEVRACAEYDDYLQGIDKRAEIMTSVSLFAEPDSFSYKNISKTPEDFAHLKGSALTIAPSKGVDMATGFLPTDIIAFVMIMSVTVTIVTREKELEQLLLSRTAFKGRAPLGAVKLFTCFAAALIAVVLLYSVNFIAAFFTYGFGDDSRQIQSVLSFNGSALKISVSEYFVLFLLTKLLVYIAFAALIFFITAIADSAVKVYVSLAVILTAESIAYYTIQPTSYLCIFKYINLVAFANTKELFCRYLNLNIFGEPVGYLPVFFTSLGVMTAVFSVLSVYAFSHTAVIKSNTKRRTFALFKGRHTGLFLHECYKVFICGKVLPILLVFAAFIYAIYTPVKERFYSKEDIYYKQLVTKYEGELTAEKEEQIAAEKKSLDTDESGDDLSSILKMQELADRRAAFERFEAHIEYLKASGGDILYDSGYKLLTGDETAGHKDTTLALTAMAMLICTLTYIYTAEYQTGAAVLLHTSARGRGAVFARKAIIGIIIVTIIYLLTYVPYFYSVLSAYGTGSIDSPACSMEHLSRFDISIRAYLILLCAVRYLALILAMLLIFFISKKAKSLISAMLIETAVFILPLLLYLLGICTFKWAGLTGLILGNALA